MPLTFTWKVGLLVPRFFLPESPLKSDNFVLEMLSRTKWTLQLVRTTIDEQDSIGVGLMNESDPDCGEVTLEHTIDVTSDEDGEQSLCIGDRHTFGRGSRHLLTYLQSEEMNELKRNVTFVLTITDHSMADAGMSDTETLSRDMKHLLRSTLFSDLTVVTDDYHVFKTHKFLMCSRWKEISCRINDTEDKLRVTGVVGSIFKVFLKCLYTGKINHYKVTPKLYDFVSKNCFDLKCAMRTLSSADISRTLLIIERKVLKWNVADSKSNPLPLFRVVDMNNLYTHEMTVALEASGEAANLMLVISFPNCNAFRPILVCGDVSLEAESNEMTFQFSDVANSESDLDIALPFSTSELDSYQLTITLDIADDFFQPVLESSEIYFSTVTPGVYDLHSLVKDLKKAQRKNMYSDVQIDTNRNGRVMGHKALLGIRSEKFRKALWEYENPRDTIWKLNLTAVDTKTMMHAIKYIYTGSVDMMRGPQLVNVYQLAQALMLHKLQAFCETLLVRPA